MTSFSSSQDVLSEHSKLSPQWQQQKKQLNYLVLILSVLTLFFLGTSLFFYDQNRKLHVKDTQSLKQSELSATSSSTIPPTEQQVYKNSTNNFEFAYPKTEDGSTIPAQKSTEYFRVSKHLSFQITQDSVLKCTRICPKILKSEGDLNSEKTPVKVYAVPLEDEAYPEGQIPFIIFWEYKLGDGKFARFTLDLPNVFNGAEAASLSTEAERVVKSIKFFVGTTTNATTQDNAGKDTYSITQHSSPGKNRLVSTEAAFSVEYPSFLNVFDFTKDVKQMGRQIFLCETDLVIAGDSDPSCPSGIRIWYDGNGLGGGCYQEQGRIATINGEKVPYCEWKSNFGLLELNLNNSHRLNIDGTYSSTFTTEVLMSILQSIKAVEK